MSVCLYWLCVNAIEAVLALLALFQKPIHLAIAQREHAVLSRTFVIR